VSDDFDFETPTGLPAKLPANERLLWQGRPEWGSFVRRALHARKIAVYFGILAAWRVAADLSDGYGVLDAAVSGLWVAALAGITLGLIALFGWLVTRTTVYNLTSERLVLRFGVALPMTVTIPLGLIRSADLGLHADGTGDLPMSMIASARISYLVFWPHVRPWHLSRAQPCLRCVPDAVRVATILAEALRAHSAAADPAPVHAAPTEALADRRAEARSAPDRAERPYVTALSESGGRA